MLDKKKYMALFILLLIPIGLGRYLYPEPAVEAFNTNNLIRFHVVANSDLPLDQSIKGQVRNAALAVLAGEFSGVSSHEEARKVITDSLPKLEQAAKAKLSQAGLNYRPRAEFGFYNFPTRSYLGLNLPAGRYEAVRLVLGEGQGENWWCVLFPPLCFVDISGTLGMLNPRNQAQPVIKKNRTDLEERAEGVEVRFKILEVWKRSKDFLANSK
ncbi:MAG: stage II sporulation protein R [Syntrophomonadaceae bacterium]|nr:stage II sporulation protein R [Syntrophomonadaceae bacterium]